VCHGEATGRGEVREKCKGKKHVHEKHDRNKRNSSEAIHVVGGCFFLLVVCFFLCLFVPLFCLLVCLFCLLVCLFVCLFVRSFVLFVCLWE